MRDEGGSTKNHVAMRFRFARHLQCTLGLHHDCHQGGIQSRARARVAPPPPNPTWLIRIRFHRATTSADQDGPTSDCQLDRHPHCASPANQTRCHVIHLPKARDAPLVAALGCEGQPHTSSHDCTAPRDHALWVRNHDDGGQGGRETACDNSQGQDCDKGQDDGNAKEGGKTGQEGGQEAGNKEGGKAQGMGGSWRRRKAE